MLNLEWTHRLVGFWKNHRSECLFWILLGVYGALLPIVFMAAVPDPIFETDSISYIRPALEIIYNQQFHISPERTPGYSLFLTALLALFRSFRAVMIVQHLLVLGTGLLAARVCVRYLGATHRAAIAVAFLTTSLPHTLIMGHSLMTESLYSFLIVLSLLLFLDLLHKPSLAWGVATGISAACVLLVRPVGWALVAALAGGWFFYPDRKRSRKAALTAVATFATITLCCFTYNLKANGFFGLDQFSGISLIGPTAKFVEIDRLPQGPVRQALEPIYRDPARRTLLSNEPWVRYGTDGPTVQLLASLHSPQQLNQALKEVALSGMAAHPFLFAQDQLRRGWEFLWLRSRIPYLYMNAEFAVLIYRGLALYDKNCDPFPAARDLTHFRAADFAPYYQQLAVLGRLPSEQRDIQLSRLHTPSAYSYDTVLSWEKPITVLTPLLKFIPILAFLLSWSLFQSPRRYVMLLLLGFLTLHILLTNLGADGSHRHAIPVEWIYWSLLLVGGSAFLEHFNERRGS